MVLSIAEQAFETAHGGALGTARLRGHIAYAIYGAKPHDILNINIVANEPLVARISIDDTDESVTLEAEVIEEGAVLTEFVAVGRIIHWRLIVAKQDDKPVLNALAQDAAAVHIGFSAE